MVVGRYWDLVLYRAFAELKAENDRAYLGILWWVLEPILYMSVFYVVFGLGLRHASEGYVSFLLCGLLPWKWLDSTTRTSSGIIATSVGLMNQVYLPKILLPIMIVLSNTIKFLLVLVLFLIFLTINGSASFETWFYLPALFLIQLWLVFIMSALAAAVVPIIPDLKYLITNGMTLLFFMSGIFFDPSQLSPEIAYWLGYNPVLLLLDNFRAILIRGESPDWLALGYLVLCLAAATLVVFLIFKKIDRIYPRIVGG